MKRGWQWFRVTLGSNYYLYSKPKACTAQGLRGQAAEAVEIDLAGVEPHKWAARLAKAQAELILSVGPPAERSIDSINQGWRLQPTATGNGAIP